jgi:hypothetical protein
LKTQEDIERLWSEGTYDPEKIQIECIVGQAFVVGSSALLSDALSLDNKGKMAFSDQRKKGKTSATPPCTVPSSTTSTSTAPSSTAPPSTESTSPPARLVFYNLAVKQKVVYQPTFKHRRWIQESKAFIPPGLDDSITDNESRLPPLRGSDASVVDYLQDLERV